MKCQKKIGKNIIYFRTNTKSNRRKTWQYTKTAVSRTVVVLMISKLGISLNMPSLELERSWPEGQGENQRVGIEFKDGLKKKLVVKFANLKK
ncbi:MAG: hypothetical protein CM1200mP10_24430 [Candidatus Neomarinimicrobiota bacterium]|nr:MAG: hypothetical protein CM1200mP10_24430 [Candidatus Neomarinimicrobiota bacterium]